MPLYTVRLNGYAFYYSRVGKCAIVFRQFYSEAGAHIGRIFSRLVVESKNVRKIEENPPIEIFPIISRSVVVVPFIVPNSALADYPLSVKARFDEFV